MIQVALDRLNRQECFHVVSEVYHYIDYIEIGTGVIKQYGMSIVQEMKERYPEKRILADMKTCDAGKHEALQAFEAGADAMTVMSFSANKTIRDSLKIAEELKKQVVVDLLGITSKDRIVELRNLGVTSVSMHVGKDMQAAASLDYLDDFRDTLKEFNIFVAGGINPERVKQFSKVHPDVYIVGSYITGSSIPAEAAKKIREVI
ncbi:3-hexulose-6-phosphate synthase [Virgibacillus oceani]|uniref:3-hexulose-6-phosphate synthase n=1 Tax=Virgibacillus oceani TaxID=1479511 RepID=A0A917M7N6_9BACI|nr:3-hexulose-6-phosphate synthase [Virgibacillus oceani]GGG83015.1 3-hexulose-6-phosphate synthase [Virgibacillus oceani]